MITTDEAEASRVTVLTTDEAGPSRMTMITTDEAGPSRVIMQKFPPSGARIPGKICMITAE